MKYLCTLFLLLALGSYCHASATQQKQYPPNAKSFDTIEKLMQFGDSKEESQERDYLHSLRDAIAKAPPEKRLGVLNKLAEETKWGTYQRFIAYYVCAWHGVNYTNTRDYLIHCAFWWEWKIGPDSSRPFSFQETGVYLLYALYERNHDFQILHDILTTRSDAATSQMIVCLTAESTEKHPRGLLHVAQMSKRGRNLVCRLLHLSPDDEDHPLLACSSGSECVETFGIYVTRVACDPKDPLCPLAKRLLKKPAHGCK